METILSICIGIGLSAACGFRIFVPLLIMGIASLNGYFSPPDNLAWVASYPAIIGLGMATCLEIMAYYIPWVDNLLDSISGPTAIVAGTLVTAGFITDMPPMIEWSLAIIAGGGSAGIIQGLTSLTRLTSTATTGGLGNPIVSTAEIGGATVLSIIAMFVPFLAIGIIFILLFLLIKKIFLRRKRSLNY